MGTLFYNMLVVVLPLIPIKIGGAKRDRTADLNTASVALSQLSYGPSEQDANSTEALTVCLALLCNYFQFNEINRLLDIF